MAGAVDLDGLRDLLDCGAQLVEVLPREEYEELRLPGAPSLPPGRRWGERRGAARARASTIRPHTSIEDLAARLAGSDVRTLIVTDPEGKLLGIVRRGDVDDSQQ